MTRSIRVRAGRLGVAVAGMILLATLAATPAAAGTEPGISFTTILEGYKKPVLVTHTGASNRRIFIVEQLGRIQIATFKNGAWRKIGTFLDIRDRVTTQGSEQGLLGLAFHPDYATNGRFYVNYTRKAVGTRDGDTVIAEYRRAGSNRADPGSRRQVLVIDQPGGSHNGGHLLFGADDMLYIFTGDGGGVGDTENRAQDLRLPLGKILRIDPDDPDGAGRRSYSVPADNPWVGKPGKRPEIWAYGLRNPWRGSVDRLTGTLLFGDVGQRSYEEINRSRPKGDDAVGGRRANYGWNACEGDHTYPGGALCDHKANGFRAPILEYGRTGDGPMDGGCAVTGGYVFRGPDAPAWQGTYLFGDLCQGTVTATDLDGRRLLTVSSGAIISSFGEDAAGRLYLVNLAGRIRAITLSGDPTP